MSKKEKKNMNGCEKLIGQRMTLRICLQLLYCHITGTINGRLFCRKVGSLLILFFCTAYVPLYVIWAQLLFDVTPCISPSWSYIKEFSVGVMGREFRHTNQILIDLYQNYVSFIIFFLFRKRLAVTGIDDSISVSTRTISFFWRHKK